MSGPTSCPGLSDAARTFCHTCHHVDTWIGVAALGAEDAAVRACTKADDVVAQPRPQSRGAGMRRDGLRALVLGLPLVRPLRPRCSWAWPSSVYARPAVVLASAMASHPPPASGRSPALR